MIKLSNGHQVDFCSASGALGFYNGWPWHLPMRWFGLLPDVTVIGKTLTYRPRKGNLQLISPAQILRGFRHCVRKVGTATVNRVGLSNPGLRWWVNRIYPRVERTGLPFIVSVMADDLREAHQMVRLLARCPAIKGVEINFSCPNVGRQDAPNLAARFVEVMQGSGHPVGIKLAYQQPYVDIAKAVEGRAEWLTLINSVPWGIVFPRDPSPFSRYAEAGGVSGEVIYPYALEAIGRARLAVKTPVMGGGGIVRPEHVYGMAVVGATAFQIGVLYKDNPFRVKSLVEECRKAWTGNLSG